MTKAPPPNVGGQPQMQMVQVYVVPMPYSADGQQQAQWSTPEQPPASGNFGAGSHMSSAAMQQTGPSQWNTWQELPNQQFANQPQHQPALQDYSGWAPGPQHQPAMQDHSQQGWAQHGNSQQHQQHPQHQQHQQHQQQQQQTMMPTGAPQQPMMGNTQQQAMMGNAAGMVGMMPQENQYYFVQGGQQAPPQMAITNNNTPPSTAPTPTAPAAAPPASAAQQQRLKKRGLMNKKLGKDGMADQDVVETDTPKKEPEPQQQIDVAQNTANAAKAVVWEPVAPRAAITGVGDSRSMIKALNLQPISAPSAKGRPKALQGKQGGPMGRAEEIQALRDFAAWQKSKDRVEETPAPAPETSEPTLHTEEPLLPIVAQQPPVVQVPPQVQPAQHQAQAPPAPLQGVPAQPQLMPMQPQLQPPLVQPQLQPQPQALPAQPQTTSAQKPTKGVRLKNVNLSRLGQGGDSTPDASAGQKPEPVRIIKTPVVMDEALSLTDLPKIEENVPLLRPDPREQERRVQLQKSVLLGRTNGFDRSMMLQFWRASKACLPIKDLGYRTASRDEQSPSPMETWRIPRKDRSIPDQSPASWRQGTGKSGRGMKAREKDQLKPGINAYKIQKAQTREAELQRDVRAQLNKICPENKDRIIERLAQSQLDTVEEMEIVINIIFHKVTDDPHYCETYVDMIHALNKAYPEFPPEEEGQAPATFRRMLVNTCQDKFEEMLSKLEEDDDPAIASMDPDELLELTLRKKRNAMATMKFIGNLFVRQLLAAAVIRRVIADLLDGEPPEMQVEYALELVTAVGRQFEGTEKDKAQISIILDRLITLKGMKGANGKPLLSKRVQFHIDDIVELRGNGWVNKKAHLEAKKKDTVREEAEREEQQVAQASQAASRQPRGYRAGRH